MQDAYDFFYEVFLSLSISGYLGPLALIVVGYILTKKATILGFLWWLVEWLFVAQYLELVDATPAYWWHVFLLIFGGLFVWVFPLWNRR